MRVDRQKIEVEPGVVVSAVAAWPQAYAAGVTPCLILAHGAGSDMDHPFLAYVHEAIAARGIVSVKFNFPYMESVGRKAPDPPQRLLRTWRAMTQWAREAAQPGALFVGGKSMGGRIASMLAANGEPVDGLVLLGYPLQPAGRPDVVRADHLARIACPMLFVQGSRDKLCELALLRTVLQKISTPVSLHVIEEGDHSFKVPKRTGKTEPQVWEEIVEVVASWIVRANRDGGCASP